MNDTGLASDTVVGNAPHVLRWKQLLTSLQVSDLLDGGGTEIIYVRRTDSVGHILEVFTKHNISSVPVYETETERFVGLVDILDLMTFCLIKMKGLQKHSWDKVRHYEEFISCPVYFLMDFSSRNAWKPLTTATPLISLMDALADPDTHRVPIVEPSGKKVVAIVTQSMVVRWLDDNKQRLGFPTGGVGVSVRDFSLVGPKSVFKKEVLQVTLQETVFAAFSALHEHRVSGMPIVDDKGAVVGSISASDLRLVAEVPTEMISRLFFSVAQLLELRSGPRKELLTCTKDDTIEAVVSKLRPRGVHRLWIVDEQQKPVGVVSLCDLIAQFTEMDALCC